MTAFEHLLQPITIGSLQRKNRLLLTPMGTELGTHDGRRRRLRPPTTPNAPEVAPAS